MTANIYKMLLLLFATVCLCSALPSPEPQPQPEPALLSSYKPSFIANPAIYSYTVASNQAQQQKQQQQQPQVKQQEYTKTLLSNDIDYNSNANSNSNDNNNNNNNNYFNYASNSNNEQFTSSSSSSDSTYQRYTGSKLGGVSMATPTTTTTATPTQPLPVSGCQLDRLAVYKVVLHTYWTRDLFPKHYPDWRPTAQWTRTLGRTHDSSYALFHIGQQATAGVKQFAETGKSDLLDSIVGEQQQQQMQHQQQLQQLQQQNVANGNSFAGFVPTANAVRGERSVFDEFNIPAVLVGDGRQETKFFVDSNHSMVSLMTRIVPSPDWFIGVDSFQLCVGGSWIDTVTVEMDPLDAGTDNGFTFTAPNWPTSPQGVIYRITSRYPAHPASSFFYPKSKRLPPIATFQFIKLKEYELSEVFNFAEDDRKYETVKTQTHLEAEHDSTITNNELSASIERERQNEISAQPTSVTERDRIRSRLLAKMNPGYNNNNSNAAANGNAANVVVPKNDKNAIMQNIANSYQRGAEASTNTSATATNWLGPLPPKRRRTKSRTKSRDCRVSHWSEWSACSKTCGIGEMHRYRKVIRHGKRGGRPCPALQESKWCGTEKGCHSPATYFNWSTT
ncbi:spondin-1 [Zeugodacus cucurbitae]|uniref:Spondin-2 n=1 Tax=Zeugodacus cucurbitae TaxID=28588 RepID=A0A0A1XST5_ZEUCU|nr:spondin-1 [Zeugodacus cucurbitae]